MKIFQLEISKYSYSDFLKEITSLLLEKKTEKGRAIFTPNPEICLKTLEDSEFLDVLNKADYLTSDGIGLYLAYQINDSKLPGILKILMLPVYVFNILFRKKYIYNKYGERICGSDLTSSLIEYSQENNIKIAILDPYYPNDLLKCESQKTFKEKLSAKFPNLAFDFYIYTQDNAAQVFEKMQRSGAKILFSTLGMKRQELSVIAGLKACPNVRLGLGIGSSFDYHIGFQKRAPKLMRTLGFEWLYRIFTSPNKLQRLGRIFAALVVFPITVLFYKK